MMTHARYYGLAAAVVVVCACGSGSSSRDARCRAEAEELEGFLTTMDHDVNLFFTDDLRLVTRGDVPRMELPRASTVSVDAEKIVLDGEYIGDRAELAERLAAARAHIANAVSMGYLPRHEAAVAKQIYLVIDEAVAWETVVWVAEAVHEAGFDAPLFVFARPPATPPPPRTWVDDEIDRAADTDGTDASARAMAVARTSEKVIESCEPLIEMSGKVAMVEDKAEFIIRSVRPALVECGCKVDLAALRSLLWRLLGNEQPTTTLGVRLARDATPIALPAATPWREASRQLTPAMSSAWLAVAK